MDPLRDVTHNINSTAYLGVANKSRPPRPTSQRSSSNDAPLVLPIPPSPSLLKQHVPRDPEYVPEYGEEIIQHLLLRERGAPRCTDYLDTLQTEITERMRMILVDWLIDVHIKFHLHPETYFLAVDIVDRYLSRVPASRAQLQLVGITSMLIAAKHEEIWPPEVRECVYISANTYSADEVLHMERSIATVLRFRFTVPTPYPMACRLLDLIDAPSVHRSLTFLFLDCAAHDYSLTGYFPSHLAYASVLLATMTAAWNSIRLCEETEEASFCSSRHWDDKMVSLSHGTTFPEVAPIAEKLLESTKSLCCSSSRLQAVRRKYLSSKYHAVASLQLPSFVVAPDEL
jgi:cyclin A